MFCMNVWMREPNHCVSDKAIILPVAYLGFHKGGLNFSAYTKRGPNYVLLFFYYVKKNFFLPKGPRPNAPPKYATVYYTVQIISRTTSVKIIIMIARPGMAAG